MPDLLLELGLEEVPARMLAAAQAELLRRATTMLVVHNLLSKNDVESAMSYSTPRRLTIYVPKVFAKQSDSFLKQLGPSAKIAYRDGQPTPAAEAFARKNGVSVVDLKTVTTDKGDYVMVEVETKGRSAAEVLADELPKEIAALYWPKNMYWRAGKPERFVRPVIWIACLLGDAVVPVTFGGKTAANLTYGHRVLHGDAPITITAPTTYLAQLEAAYVLADVEARRQKIRKALDHTTRTIPNLRWREDHPLVDAVTHLTEWPDVLLGSFEPTYLDLPEEVLVTVMRDHQKYFALETADGKLAPHFLTVTNIALTDANTVTIRQGNERVLRARFNDARFFWEFDRRIPLQSRTTLLENVTFQKDLGSYAAKSQRVLELVTKLTALANDHGGALDQGAVGYAAILAKADLTTELVKEFTELQGILGGLYARAEGIDPVVSDAIYDQYLPASAKDAIPRSGEGCILGLADRIDTIAGMFSLGLEPTGSKDPFGLRRAANAIVRILAESALPLKLSDVLRAPAPAPEVITKLEAFFAERIDFYLREGCDQAYDVAKAVMAAGSDDLPDLVARARAITADRGSKDFLAVSDAFKRMKNILAQARDKGIEPAWFVDASRFIDPSEEMLMMQAKGIGFAVNRLRQEKNYGQMMEAIAMLRPHVDLFFDSVMIMDPDEAVRANRLALLVQVQRDFEGIADFSEIVNPGS